MFYEGVRFIVFAVAVPIHKKLRKFLQQKFSLAPMSLANVNVWLQNNSLDIIKDKQCSIWAFNVNLKLI
jgi:hypothetical protein